MAKKHATYTAKEKTEIVLRILQKGRDNTIQKVAAEKNIVPTLISLWKKQAEEAILKRFENATPGRRKSTEAKAEVKEDARAAKAELRRVRTRATKAENKLKEVSERLVTLEQGVNAMSAAMGCKLVKKRAKRGSRKA
ncbi:MAG: hypothetical protein IJB00_08380 [Akkermansia sp.]|nr:hypothetical protein [Akkermansia sp.]